MLSQFFFSLAIAAAVVAALVMASSRHRYTSTACTHGEHRECRRFCKFCGARCRCACHKGVTRG
jgi:hypothetical protein